MGSQFTWNLGVYIEPDDGLFNIQSVLIIQGGSNMTGTDLCVNKPHCAAAVRPW